MENQTQQLPELVKVVAGVRRMGRLYWACRRKRGSSHSGLGAGMWEYPGGKVEEGETLEQALRREMREEFGIEVEIGRELTVVTTRWEDHVYEVHFFAVSFDGNYVLRDHDMTEWFTVKELQQQKHLPSGTIFNKMLADGLVQT